VEKFHKNVLTRGQIPYFYELKLSLLMHNFILFDKVVYWSCFSAESIGTISSS